MHNVHNRYLQAVVCSLEHTQRKLHLTTYQLSMVEAFAEATALIVSDWGMIPN